MIPDYLAVVLALAALVYVLDTVIGLLMLLREYQAGKKSVPDNPFLRL
jgi:hypothetical protein